MRDITRKISVIGLGYVGLYAAVAFGKKKTVIGFDIDRFRIKFLTSGYDNNKEIDKTLLQSSKVVYTTHVDDLIKANFHIVTVPTPLDKFKNPNLNFLINATTMLGKIIKKNDIIVYESTVYPGVTEDICIPLLERSSGLICGKDFSVGYSPERINPSDKNHTFTNTKKIVSAIDDKTLKTIMEVYKTVITANLCPVSNIRVAEAAKLVENTQRDINIALINEMALILHTIGVNSPEVFAAAETKWNFIPFRPGLVGGHCIGFNSHLLAYKAEELGYHPNLIYAARNVNNLMPKYIARETIKKLIRLNVKIKNARIGVFGFTYKENCADYRDTKVIDLINELKNFQTKVLVHDPLADAEGVKKEYKIDLNNWNDLNKLDAIIFAVGHDFYLKQSKNNIIKKFLPGKNKLIVDIKSILDPKKYKNTGITLWQI